MKARPSGRGGCAGPGSARRVGADLPQECGAAGPVPERLGPDHDRRRCGDDRAGQDRDDQDGEGGGDRRGHAGLGAEQHRDSQQQAGEAERGDRHDPSVSGPATALPDGRMSARRPCVAVR